MVAVLLELIPRFALKSSIAVTLEYSAITELVLLLSIEVDRMGLKGQSGVGTFRRLAAISIVSNLVWLALGVIALIVLLVSGSDGKFIALMITGLFFAIAFRAFIFGAAFYGNTFHGLPLSFVQPLLISIPVFLPSFSLISGYYIAESLAAGILYLIAIEIYLYFVNKTPLIGGSNPLQLLQAFLDAWTLEEPTKLEGILDSVSSTSKVTTELLSMRAENGSTALIVVPGVHPGPFYPVGSSNLPANIYSALRTASVLPLTVHSISDHELNLPSQSEVKKYTLSLKEPKTIDSGRQMTSPVVKTRGKATVMGIAFGRTNLITITQAPHGMEDLPMRVRREIEDRSRLRGYSLSLVVDTHNSEGPKPSESECGDIISCTQEVLEELSKSKTHQFRLGFAHSSEIRQPTHRDIGPAGLALLVFESDEDRFCLAIVDANNARLGFREKSFQAFKDKTGATIAELCTSDTHVTAARATGAKGYLALGDITSVDEFVSILSSLFALAQGRMEASSFTSESVLSEVKTIGGKILTDFSQLADKTSQTAKRGAEVLAILGLAFVLIAII
jgi:putative membrane protein